MPDNHLTPEEREGLINALVDAMRCGPETGHVFRIIPEIAVDNVLAAGWRPQPPERPKPEVGVEEIAATVKAHADKTGISLSSRWAKEVGVYRLTDPDIDSIAQVILGRLSEAAPPAVEGWRAGPPPKDGSRFWAYLYQSGIRLLFWITAEQIAQEEGGDPDDWNPSWVEITDHKEVWEPAYWLPFEALPAPTEAEVEES